MIFKIHPHMTVGKKKGGEKGKERKEKELSRNKQLKPTARFVFHSYSVIHVIIIIIIIIVIIIVIIVQFA